MSKQMIVIWRLLVLGSYMYYMYSAMKDYIFHQIMILFVENVDQNRPVIKENVM